jgi:hypothetical protein
MAITDEDARNIEIAIMALQQCWGDNAKRLLEIVAKCGNDVLPEVKTALLETATALHKASVAHLPGDRTSYLPDHYIGTRSPHIATLG